MRLNNFCEILFNKNLELDFKTNTKSNLGNHNSLSNNGEGDIMRKVPVRAGYNEMIYDNGSGLTGDYFDCSNQTLSGLHFKMKDSYGNNTFWKVSVKVNDK